MRRRTDCAAVAARHSPPAKERGELKLDEIQAMFDYVLSKIQQDKAVKDYVADAENGYEKLPRLLRKLGENTRMPSEFLFVYGTLRRSFPLHRILASASAKYIGNGHIRGRLYNLGPYPGVYQPPRSVGHVVGEVYELLPPETQLKKLDHEEDFKPETPKASLFIRR